jgi:hypothetical protein
MAINQPTRPKLSEELERFLAAQDLDELGAARDEIKVITRADAGVLAEIVSVGTDEQAMSNFLMYPEVIPAHLRIPTVLAALQRPPADYRLLAAVVGLGRLELDVADQKSVAQRLLELSARTDTLISALAARAFGYVAGAYDVQLAVERLGDLRPTERHNVLAALVNQFGTGPIYTALEIASALSLMSPDDAEAIQEQVARGEHDPLSNLRIPLLTYIPDLAEWHPGMIS